MCALILFAGAMASSIGVARAGLVAGLSEDEARRLSGGELVVRPVAQRKGSLDLLGGTSYQIIDAAPEVVWKALLDTPRYRHMMPRVIEARLVHDATDERTVFMRQGAEGFIEKDYYLRVKVDRERRDLTFVIDERRPHDLDAAWGFYSVRAYPEGRTLLTYGVMADIGDGLLVSLLGHSFQKWLLRSPWMVKRFVEGSGAHLYR